MGKPRLLDLFCGGGGAGMGYHRAGFEVVGVDINKQRNYPFEFHQADVFKFSIRGFDAIHASPPCQAYTKKVSTWGRKRSHWGQPLDLLALTRNMLEGTELPYVIENVGGSPLNGTLMLCGTMFGLKIIKHRFFEMNWEMPIMTPTCNHNDAYNPWQGEGRSADRMRKAMGIDWLPISGGASRKAGYTGDLFNAIPPAYTEYIGKYLVDTIKGVKNGTL